MGISSNHKDFNGYEARNVSLHRRSTDATEIARVYFHDPRATMAFHNGTEVINLGRLNQITPPNGSLSLNSQKITGLANGADPQDAATVAQVEQARQGSRSKAPVEAAATGNVNIANPGTDTFDGVTVATGEAILLPAQTTVTEIGIYVFNGSASALTRRDDADAFGELDAGAETFVQGGSAGRGQRTWRQLNELTSFAGQDWQVVSAGTTYTAGDGLTESPAGTFNVVGTTGRIVVASDSIDLAGGIVAAGTYREVTVDEYGRVTAGANPTQIQKVSGLIGNGTLTEVPFAHNLNTKQLIGVALREVATDEPWDPDFVYTNNNTITFRFGVAPTTGQFEATVAA